MKNSITIIPAGHRYVEAFKGLLRSENLPADDLSDELDCFLFAIDNGSVVGGIGLEIYGNNGLLRSLVVKSEYRGLQIANKLVTELEDLATKKQLDAIYLLTETASKYFERKGYSPIDRGWVPGALKQSSEFSHVCPVSALVMRKQIH